MRVRKILAFVIVAATTVAAQTFRGGIVGTVTDNKGAGIEEAKVTAINTVTGLTRDALTSLHGYYGLPELPIGEYALTVRKSGFRTQVLSGIHISVNRTELADITMAPGDIEQKVEAKALIPPVNTLNRPLRTSLEADQLSNLPVNGRDFKKLLDAIPGANMDASKVSDSPGSLGVVAVDGNRGRSNYFLLDGSDLNDRYHNQPMITGRGVNGLTATLLPLDSIQEMNIQVNPDAGYGRDSGAVINLVTKSGTNDLHGSLFEYFRNDALDARNYFNVRPAHRDTFHNNQYGGSAGGAIFPDKTFWFLSYEGQREHVGSPQQATIPSQAQITASAATSGPNCSAAPCINPIIQNILNLNPWGPLPAAGDDPLNPASPHTLQTTLLTTNRLDNVLGKIDHRLRTGDLVSVRYFFGYGKQNAPFSTLGGSDVLPGYNTVAPTRVHDGAVAYTHVFSPKLLVDLRLGWAKLFDNFLPEDVSINPALLGLNTTTNPHNYGLPVINVDSLASVGTNKTVARGRTDTDWQYVTNFAYDAGRQNWKFGFEYGKTSVNQYFDANHRGTLTFASLTDFLAGAPSSGSQTFGNTFRNTHQKNFAFYFQDGFRYTPRLTFNAGVRWDYFGVLGENTDLLSTFDPSVGLQQVGTAGAPSSLYPKDKNNFSPRLAAAYDLFGTGRTVVHAGWGMMYDQFSQDLFLGQLGYNTNNLGPAYNGMGTNPVLYGTVDPAAFQITTFPTGPCPGNQITVSVTSAGSVLCTGPVFSNFTARDVFTVSQKLRTPYIQNYNLNIEQQAGAHAAVVIGYVGSLGRKLMRYRDLNQPNPVTGVRPFDFGPFTSQGTPYGVVNQLETTANSSYNSAQVQFRVRNLRGFTSVLNYTYSHSIDNASDGIDYVPNAALPDNGFNPRADRGNSNFDARHRFIWYFTYRLPESRTMRWVTSGWALDGAVSVSSGMPFTVNDTNVFNTFQLNPSSPVGEFIERPDVVGNPFQGTSTPGAFLNLSAFATPCSWNATLAIPGCSGGNHFGTERRNQFYGPHYRNFDLSFSKNTQVTERVAMQLRLSVFNVFNHPNFANPLLPSGIVNWTQNGIDATGRGIGFLPLTATPDVGAGNPFLGSGGPRNLEVAVRFSF